MSFGLRLELLFDRYIWIMDELFILYYDGGFIFIYVFIHIQVVLLLW